MKTIYFSLFITYYRLQAHKKIPGGIYIQNYCPHCGATLKENADFCLSCGKLTQEQPRHNRTTYQTISKTMIAIIGFFAINFLVNIISSMFNNMGVEYLIEIIIPVIITLVLAMLIAVIAFIENSNRQLSKEVFIIALVMSGFYIIQAGYLIIFYLRFSSHW